MHADHNGRKVAVIVGATSKWQGDGINTLLAHDRALPADDFPKGIRWGLGGAIALRFAREGYFVVLTSRSSKNALALEAAIKEEHGDGMVVELDLSSADSVAEAFRRIRASVGDPEVLVYNAGSMLGRDLPPDRELLEYLPVELFDAVLHVAARGPFLVAKEVLPAMRKAGRGTVIFTNNQMSLRGKKRETGESLYYPRVMSRTLSQVLTEEYSQYGIHVATVIIDGYIDSPGTRALLDYAGTKPFPSSTRPRTLLDPRRIADAYFYLHSQDRSCWTHEIQLTPFDQKPAY
jgi:NAD(P)-dependent dehydrogenase (short-subunit alcohol dehydrogenase family)